MGKRLGKDRQRGKVTYPSLLGVEESRGRSGGTDRRSVWRDRILRSGGAAAPRTGGIRGAEEPLMSTLLETIRDPADLRGMSLPQLEQLAGEIREVLCDLIACRSAHFASNLGVVELCLALHQAFDFRTRPADLGHRPSDLSAQADHRPLRTSSSTIRTKGGLMGYPNPAESDYDLFMTGHAGCERLDRARPARAATTSSGRKRTATPSR